MKMHSATEFSCGAVYAVMMSVAIASAIFAVCPDGQYDWRKAPIRIANMLDVTDNGIADAEELTAG